MNEREFEKYLKKERQLRYSEFVKLSTEKQENLRNDYAKHHMDKARNDNSKGMNALSKIFYGVGIILAIIGIYLVS